MSIARSFCNRCWLRCSSFRSAAACTSLRTPMSGRWTVSAPSRSLAAFFLAAYVLGHMNSVFVFARLYLRIDSDWAFATGAPSGLVKDAWNIRLVPHYGLAVFFVLSHLAAGGRSVLLAHGVARRFADRFLIASATAAGLVALVIMLGMCGARLTFAMP